MEGGDTYEFRQMENRGRKDGTDGNTKKLLEHRIKNYERNSKSLTRKARTHQLCTYGGMLEKYFPDIVYLPDVEVNSFLSILSKMPEVQKVLQEISDTNSSL